MTVRFGRTGTSDRTPVTGPASAGAATAHVMTLVADKEKEGYRADGSAATGRSHRPDPRSA
ncbi:WGR domain-containing protein [Saccharothrix texasensis]|uniref:WGR domain-containing protein n=1 Tax=Saccharothrix texasensis TaxID=103734 RepID=UPI0014768B03